MKYFIKIKVSFRKEEISMYKTMERFCSYGIVVFLGVLLIGLVSVPMVQAQRAEDQQLRLGYKHGDLKTLDPHRATGSQDRIVVEMIFNGLLRYQPGNLSTDLIGPDLAKNVPTPEMLPDGRQQWIFHLREGVIYHPYDNNPGYELTSEDVVFSLRRAADPKRSAFSGDYSGMSFEAIGKYTIKVILEKPVSPYLFLPKFANVSGGFIVCKKALEEKGDEWYKTHPVGTGPFMFKSYKHMEKVALVRNSKYFRNVPKLGGVELYYMPDLNSREMAFQKGEVDVIEGPREQAWFEKMKKIPGAIVENVGNSETIVAHFNMSVKPLDLLKVRQAIAYALNREEFSTLYGEKISEPIYSVVPAGQMISGLSREECSKANLLYEFDLAKAKKLLAEAGYPKGFSLDVFTSESDSYRKAYELIQAQLRKIGINLNLAVVDHSTFHTRIRQNLNPIVVYLSFRPNPDAILTHFFHSDSIVVTGKKPIANFSHLGAVDADGNGTIDSIDNLIENARKERDTRKQVELWKEAQRKILQYVAAYPFISLGYPFAWKPYVDWGYKMVWVTDGPKATEQTQILKK